MNTEHRTPSTGRSTRRRSVVALTIILACFAAEMWVLYVPAFPFDDADANAFFRTAKGLAVDADPAQRTSEPFTFVGEQMFEVGDGVYYSKYPIGYPLLCALAYRIGGPSAPFLVNPVMAILTLLGMYLLGTALSGSRAIGALAAALLAINPVHLSFAVSPLSHSASVCCATWGMLFLWRWTRSGGFASAALAGAITAFGATVRYPDALLVLPLLAMVIWRCTTSERLGRTAGEALVMALTALLAVLPQLAYQWVAFGSPWSSGYGYTAESTAFGWAWFVQHAPWIFYDLVISGLLPVVLLGLAGIVYLAVVDAQRALFLGLWSVPLALLYCSYYCIMPDGFFLGNLRYYLTMFPAFILSALLLVSAVRRPRWARAALLVFCFLPLLHNAFLITDASPKSGELSRSLSDQLRAAVPVGAVVVSAERLLYFLDYEGRYQLYDLSPLSPGHVQWTNQTLASVEPTPFQPARLAKMRDLLAGKSVENLAAMKRAVVVEQLAAGRRVVLLTTDSAAADALLPFQNSLRIVKIREVPLSLPTGNESADRRLTVGLYGLERLGS